MVLNPGNRRMKHKESVVHVAGDPDFESLEDELHVVYVSVHF